MPTTDPATAWPNYREADFIIKNYVFAIGRNPAGAQAALPHDGRRRSATRRERSSTASCCCRAIPGPARTGCGRRSPMSCSSPASRSTRGSISSSCRTRSAAAARQSRRTGSGAISRITAIATWSKSGYRLITEGLGIGHLRLVIGSSMGGMHAWMWAEMYPGPDGRRHPAVVPAGRDQRPQLARPPRRGRGDPPRPGLERRLL